MSHVRTQTMYLIKKIHLLKSKPQIHTKRYAIRKANETCPLTDMVTHIDSDASIHNCTPTHALVSGTSLAGEATAQKS